MTTHFIWTLIVIKNIKVLKGKNKPKQIFLQKVIDTLEPTFI